MTEGVLVGPLLDYSAPLRHLADIRFNNPGLEFEILFRTIPELQRLRELRWFTWSVAELRCQPLSDPKTELCLNFLCQTLNLKNLKVGDSKS